MYWYKRRPLYIILQPKYILGPLERRVQVKKEQVVQGGSKLINSKGIIVKSSDSKSLNNGSNSIRILKNYALKKSSSDREKEIRARAAAEEDTIKGRELDAEDDIDTNFIDNVGLTVIMPGGKYYTTYVFTIISDLKIF